MRKVVLHNRWKRVLFSAIKNLRPSDLSYTIFLGVLLFISFTGIATAQEPKDIGTQTVTVVKSFTPTVADADKIKSVPQINDSLELQKKQIAYTIFSVPVASTFTPAKAKAERVKKVPPPVLYNTYAALGLGSFNNAQADFYTSQEIGRDEHLLDVAFNHFSSRGAIEGTPLETNFYDTDLQVGYTVSERDREWGATATLGHQLYHWYGLQPDTFTEAQVTALDEQQNYFAAGAKGHFTMEDSFFKRGELAINRFWDALDSQENRFIGTVQWEAPISTELVDFEVVADYVGGNFANAPLDSIANTEGIDFGHLILSGGPSLTVIREALTVNLGANVTYGMDLERKEGTFSFYPAITASYRLIDDQVIAYGGLEGGLDQNTYQSFVDSNPFVSPTLLIRPTDRQYDGFAGIKGQWTSNIGYNVKGFYRAENNRALFRLNPQNTARMD
ncbi:MAG: TonB-dependent receptor [Bacteroidota bacterium]